MTEEITLATTYQPATITANFDEMRARLDAYMEPYRDMDDEALAAMERRDIADLRRDVNALINSVEDGRKRIKAEYNKPLAAFEERVRELLEPAKAASAQLKAHIDRKDEMAREGRRERLASYYKEIGGLLCDVVPFERLYDPDWAKSDAKFKNAFDALFNKCRALQRDVESLKRMGGLFDAAETERDLYRTLDLQGALARDDGRRAEAGRLEAMKREMEGYQQPVAVAEPVFEPEPVADEATRAAQPAERPLVYTVELVLTRAEKARFITVMKANGIHGSFVGAAREVR